MLKLSQVVLKKTDIVSTDIVTKAAVADLLGVTTRTVDRWHSLNQGPPRINIGGQVRYRMSSVHRWLANRERALAASSQVS